MPNDLLGESEIEFTRRTGIAASKKSERARKRAQEESAALARNNEGLNAWLDRIVKQGEELAAEKKAEQAARIANQKKNEAFIADLMERVLTLELAAPAKEEPDVIPPNLPASDIAEFAAAQTTSNKEVMLGMVGTGDANIMSTPSGIEISASYRGPFQGVIKAGGSSVKVITVKMNEGYITWKDSTAAGSGDTDVTISGNNATVYVYYELIYDEDTDTFTQELKSSADRPDEFEADNDDGNPQINHVIGYATTGATGVIKRWYQEQQGHIYIGGSAGSHTMCSDTHTDSECESLDNYHLFWYDSTTDPLNPVWRNRPLLAETRWYYQDVTPNWDDLTEDAEGGSTFTTVRATASAAGWLKAGGIWQTELVRQNNTLYLINTQECQPV